MKDTTFIAIRKAPKVGCFLKHYYALFVHKEESNIALTYKNFILFILSNNTAC